MKTKDNFERGAKVTKDNQIFGTAEGANGHSPQSEPPALKGKMQQNSKERNL